MSTYEKLTKQVEKLTKENERLQNELNNAIIPKFKLKDTVWWIGRGPKYEPKDGKVNAIKYVETKMMKEFHYEIVKDDIYFTLSEDYLYATKEEASIYAKEIYHNKEK